MNDLIAEDYAPVVEWESILIDDEPHRRIVFPWNNKNICVVNRLGSSWFMVWVESSCVFVHRRDLKQYILEMI